MSHPGTGDDDEASEKLKTSLWSKLQQRLRALKLGKAGAHRAKAAADLHASEVRFRGVLAASPDAVLMVNNAGVIEFASDRVFDIFGYAPEELVDKPVSILIPERFRGGHLPHLNAYFTHPKTRMMGGGLLLSGRRKDATEFPAEISLSPIAMAGRSAAIAAVRDVSERRALEALQQKAAEALRESEERLRYFIKYAPAAIAILDKELRYLVYSDRWLADYGLGGQDLRGLSHYEVFPEIPERWRQIHRRALEGETLHADEDSFTRHDGRVQWLRWEVRPWFDTLGRIGGVAFLTEDITDRKRMESQLLQAQKMQAIGQLTGGVAHDFNNLLTVILGNAEVLLDELNSHDAHRKLVEPIVAAAERGASLTQLMLAFARRQALEPSTFDLNEVVTRMNSLLRRTIGENVEVDLRLTKSLWTVTADIRQMETAILNVILNARDAMPQGGKLTIETSNVELSDDYAAHRVEVDPGQYVMLALSDTGSGIAPGVIDRIFEPFFTTKPVGKGTGLGLSMVHGFVKQTGGHIQIYSEVGHGTCVKIFLPRAKADATTAVQPARAPATLATGAESILVVEDDPHVRMFAVQQLRRLGYTVTEASDGPSALQQVTRSGAPDLLFTDVVMPGGMTGRQLAERVGQMAPGTKILYTSGYTENAIVHHGRLDPGVHLLQKPYRGDKLARKVREVLDL
ncbi:hybrid sensor histidine kinase/response regulator [Bradyrhizobium guangzhouense]|uniref:histidine kinase n=1 Tax=Bradyrhizobium guangzhouense TaxID=1325095 RepID=A0AAE5X1L9_9BRAD|nr:PAS domain S-box protein [Bradyrhizobium guangzhouense]QAU47089.1 hybrid sensor histidine kinase/response regulator [Bradyrhizobium guangzhouense]RXH11230.1 PAS domain S-box protein [Bradyrhizobium guangzhouense]